MSFRTAGQICVEFTTSTQNSGPAHAGNLRQQLLAAMAETYRFQCHEPKWPTTALGMPQAANLLGRISPEKLHPSVSRDDVDGTKDRHETIALRPADAIAPIQKNSGPWMMNRTDAGVRNEILRVTSGLERAIWKKWGGYFRRSLIETKMRCFKLLRHASWRATFDCQETELQIRAAVLNRFKRLRTPMAIVMP